MEKYFLMVTYIEHHWGFYLAGAWLLGPTLFVYLSDGFWMACAIFLYWRIACTRFSKRWNLCPRLLPVSLGEISEWLIDIWSSCRATTTSKQSRLKNSCSVHTGLPEVLDSAVGSLHLHGRATFWFTLATTAPRPVFVLFCIFFSQTPKNIEPTSAQVPWLKSDIRWVILSKKSPRNLLIIPTIYNMPSSSQFLH